MLGFQVEKITEQNTDLIDFPDLERPFPPASRLQPVLGEKRFDREPADFHAGHRMAFAGQPQQVAALAAQRGEHPLTGTQVELGPELLEMNVDVLLVKTDLASLPAFVPKTRFHGRASRLGEKESARPPGAGREQRASALQQITQVLAGATLAGVENVAH